MYLKTFWKYFKFFIVRDMGLLTNNFHRSLIFMTIYSLNNKLWNPYLISKQEPLPSYFTKNRKYLKPVSILHFSFNKQSYNTIIFYIFYLITIDYYSPQNDFNLHYSFILHQDNFKLLFFCNMNYFKLFNY